MTLTPFFKGYKPFDIWVIDLIVGLPPGSDGQTICLVCICSFSKFVVARALKDKSSQSITNAFYTAIIAEYGVPTALRCDNGTEFRGVFAQLLKMFKIYRYPATAYYPQALGQVEVTNKTIKTMLRKFDSASDGLFWDEALPDIVLGIRTSVSAAHGFTPYELVFKQ